MDEFPFDPGLDQYVKGSGYVDTDARVAGLDALAELEALQACDTIDISELQHSPLPQGLPLLTLPL